MNYFNIQAAAQISGVSVACIRVWEKRYNCVQPTRSSNNHRLYSQTDIEKLTLLNHLTLKGLKISQLTMIPIDELKAIYQELTQKNFEGMNEDTTINDFSESLTKIQECLSGHHYEIADHEIKKIVESSSSRDLALTFYPGLQLILKNLSERLVISNSMSQAFLNLLRLYSEKRISKERTYLRETKALLINFMPTSSITTNEISLAQIISSARLDINCLNYESSDEFMTALNEILKPDFIFCITSPESSEFLKFISDIKNCQFLPSVIVLNPSAKKINSKFGYKRLKVFTALSEVNDFLEHEAQH